MGSWFRPWGRHTPFLLVFYLVSFFYTPQFQAFAMDEMLAHPGRIREATVQIRRLPQVELTVGTDNTIPVPVPSSVPFAGPTPLEQLIQYALASNPELAAAQYRARQLGARVPQAKSLPDPQLITTAFLQSIQTAAGPQEAAMSLSQKFPWFGKLSLRSQVAYQDAMAAYAQAAAVELTVVEQVKLAYYDLYFFQNAIAETKKLEQPLKDITVVARSRYETNIDPSGMVSLLQTEIELAKLQTELVQLEEARVKTQARLAGTLHLPPQTRIDAMRDLLRSNVPGQADTFVGLAQIHQPELEARRREIARDRSAISLACRDYYPDVTFGFNWYEIGDSGISPVADGRDAYSLTAGVNLPIYRQRLNAAVREAQYKKTSSNRQYAASQDRFQTEILSLYAQFQEQDRIITILESRILQPAEQALELSTELYRTGKIEYEQLIDTFRTLLDFRVDYYRRFAQREQAIASLERAVGCEISSQLNMPTTP